MEKEKPPLSEMIADAEKVGQSGAKWVLLTLLVALLIIALVTFVSVATVGDKTPVIQRDDSTLSRSK